MVSKFTIIEPYLSNYKKPLCLAELSKYLNKPHQTIKPYLTQLTKDQILTKEGRNKRTDYYLNLKEPKTIDYITIAEKQILLNRKDPLLKILLEKLPLNKLTFIIFGSFSQGSKAEDIDLLAIGEYNIKEIEDFENTYNKKIHLIQIKKETDTTLTLLKEVYKKHLILNNTETVVRWFVNETNRLV